MPRLAKMTGEGFFGTPRVVRYTWGIDPPGWNPCMPISDAIRSAAIAAAVSELTAALLRRYGPTMDSEALARLLHIQPSSLRMRRQRGANLPPHLGDTHAVAYSTAAVALWLVGVQPSTTHASNDDARADHSTIG